MDDIALTVALGALRQEYRSKMNKASDAAVEAAGVDEMDKVSMFSTEAERMREAFMALNRAIAIVDAHNE